MIKDRRIPVTTDAHHTTVVCSWSL